MANTSGKIRDANRQASQVRTRPSHLGNAERERIRTALKLADDKWRDFNRRRAVEWKVNFALWTALGALAGVYWKTGRGEGLDVSAASMLSFGLILVECIYWFWSVGLWRRNREDQYDAYAYRHQAGGEAPKHQYVRSWKDALQVLAHWSHGSQIYATGLLIVIAIFGVMHSAKW
jgi:hypothetical protein